MSLRTLLKSDRYAKTIIEEAMRDCVDRADLRQTLHEEFPDEDIDALLYELE